MSPSDAPEWPVASGHYPNLRSASAADVRHANHAAQAALDAVVQECRHLQPGVDFDGCAIDADAVAALVDEARGADLLVVGRSGAGRVERVLLGSVTEAVLRHSPCPVAVVPATSTDRVGRVVVGIDGSPASTTALRWAAAEAELRRAELVVLHAWEYPYRLTAEGIGRGSDLAEVDAAIVTDRAVETARDVTAGAVSSQLVEGGAVQAVLDASRSADLVVVGSRGRGGFRTMLLGSVAHGVAGNSACPVVVVR